MGERAVSTVVTYLMVLGIVTVLTSTLFVSMSGFVGGQQESAVRTELEVVGNRLAADLSTADRLALTDASAKTVRVSSELPDRTAGSTYEVEIVHRGDGLYEIVLRSHDPEVTVRVYVRTRTPVETGTVRGGDVLITYDGSGSLEVKDA